MPRYHRVPMNAITAGYGVDAADAWPAQLAQRTGWQVVAAGFYREIAKRGAIPLIEKALPAVLSDASLKLDPLHPSSQGHRVLAERTFDELRQMGFAAGR